MGFEFTATCLGCRHQFTACEGGGFEFQLLRCDRCGDTKGVPLEPPRRSILQRVRDLIVGRHRCRCGGRFCRDAPVRCPKCRSTNIETGEVTANYD